MNNLSTAQFKWRIYRLIDGLSLIAKLALGLLATAALGYVLVVRPQQLSLFNLASPQTGKTNTLQTASTPTAELNAYTAQFPQLAMRAAKINALIDIAKQQNLLLDEVTYKSEANINQSLNHYQMTFSVFAPYPEVHQFLSNILTQMPYVAIESLNINRESVQDDFVEARIQLTFYFANTL